jgi:hypothetical protein
MRLLVPILVVVQLVPLHPFWRILVLRIPILRIECILDPPNGGYISVEFLHGTWNCQRNSTPRHNENLLSNYIAQHWNTPHSMLQEYSVVPFVWSVRDCTTLPCPTLPRPLTYTMYAGIWIYYRNNVIIFYLDHQHLSTHQ